MVRSSDVQTIFRKILIIKAGDNRLGFGENAVFMSPEEDMIEIDCSQYENAATEYRENNKKTSDFDEEF
ncbi:MAG: hypothetical protein IPP49_12145 [Saprospiraceae bacterium]|nr:hypothetical protein [Saprospiraceae bacterium]